jgi:hypothetical protein
VRPYPTDDVYCSPTGVLNAVDRHPHPNAQSTRIHLGMDLLIDLADPEDDRVEQTTIDIQLLQICQS